VHLAAGHFLDPLPHALHRVVPRRSLGSERAQLDLHFAGLRAPCPNGQQSDRREQCASFHDPESSKKRSPTLLRRRVARLCIRTLAKRSSGLASRSTCKALSSSSRNSFAFCCFTETCSASVTYGPARVPFDSWIARAKCLRALSALPVGDDAS